MQVTLETYEIKTGKNAGRFSIRKLNGDDVEETNLIFANEHAAKRRLRRMTDSRPRSFKPPGE